MGYRVDYGPMDRAMRGSNYRIIGWPVLLAAFFLCFLIMVSVFWPQGREVLADLLFPWDWEAVESALTAFREGISAGDSAMSCAEAFCRQILLEAKFGIG